MHFLMVLYKGLVGKKTSSLIVIAKYAPNNGKPFYFILLNKIENRKFKNEFDFKKKKNMKRKL